MTVAWDARASVWVTASDLVQQMMQLRQKWGEKVPNEPLPECYWAMRAEAELLVGLASVPDTMTGVIAGATIEGRARAEAEREDLRRTFFADRFAQRDKPEGNGDD